MSMEQIMGVARALLAAGGGYLVSRGLIDPTQLETVIGAVLTVGAAVWSIIAKKKIA